MAVPPEGKTPHVVPSGLSRNRYVALIAGLVVLGVGTLTLVWNPGSLFVLRMILGGVFIFVGGSETLEALAARKEGDYWPLLLLRGGLSVVFGTLALTWPNPTQDVLAWLVGINLILYGVLGITSSRQIPRDVEAHSRSLWRGILALGLGIVMVVWPRISVVTIARIAGFYFIFFGIMLMVASHQLRKLHGPQEPPAGGASSY